MPDITISITDTEKKALEYAMLDITDWTDNAVTNRARIAKDEIISIFPKYFPKFVSIPIKANKSSFSILNLFSTSEIKSLFSE